MIIAERLKFIEENSLRSGAHSPESKTFCALEAVAYVAGEPWSDHPSCACPVISAFLRSWNDSLPTDADRDRLLKPLVPKLVGSKATIAIEKKRAIMATDWFIRVHLPAWLRLAGLPAQADAISSLPEITNFAKCPSLQPSLEAIRKDAAAAWATARDAAWAAAWATARDAAWAAAWAAARDAARDAAKDAAKDAARDAAWAAAGAAAWDAARDAARDAAKDAARAAAWAAARKKFQPVVSDLQQSAVKLIERMIEIK